jgi:hypothetical protein
MLFLAVLPAHQFHSNDQRLFKHYIPLQIQVKTTARIGKKGKQYYIRT